MNKRQRKKRIKKLRSKNESFFKTAIRPSIGTITLVQTQYPEPEMITITCEI